MAVFLKIRCMWNPRRKRQTVVQTFEKRIANVCAIFQNFLMCTEYVFCSSVVLSMDEIPRYARNECKIGQTMFDNEQKRAPLIYKTIDKQCSVKKAWFCRPKLKQTLRDVQELRSYCLQKFMEE